MPNLFDPLRMKSMELGNRFVRSATMDTFGDQGMMTDDLLDLYRELSRGEIGLIITGGIYAGEDGCIAPGQLGAHTDETVPSLKRLADAVHESGGKIAAQLFHSGYNSRPESTGNQPVGPSPMVHPRTGLEARELSGDEIERIIEQFGQAARRVMEAGLDAVQLHAAHSWLPSAFLSPAANRREDAWGGPPENRLRFVRHICRAMRKSVGTDFPILIKLGLKDYHPEGKSLAEGIDAARALEADGVDAIEISEGFEEELAHHIRCDATSPYYLEECRQARQALSVPLILVGGMRKRDEMQAVLDEGMADAVSMCRPFIMDPHAVRKLRDGSALESECNSCNGCLVLLHGEPRTCVLI
jgi:2,4-dienoyl-CoA reductase-like NADH-dependent reductase (Old Yellow Enzyme family)